MDLVNLVRTAGLSWTDPTGLHSATTHPVNPDDGPAVGCASSRRSDGIPSLTQPVKIVIDCSSDRIRAAYVALIVDGGQKSRLIYGIGWHIGPRDIEMWGIKRALRRVNTRYDGQRPIIVYTDALAVVNTRGNVHVQYRWLRRNDPLMRHLDRAANRLRRSMPLQPV